MDAAQALGKILLNVSALDADLVSLSAHKAYGPKGIGALYVRGGHNIIPLEPLIYGGGQEKGLRGGTLAVPLVVGFGKACQLAVLRLPDEPQRLSAYCTELVQLVRYEVDGIQINGHPEHSLPGLVSMSIAGLEGESLMYALPDMAFSQGSSCNTGRIEPSHVLTAIGLKEPWLSGTIRLSVGRFTAEEEVKEAAARLVQGIRELREG